MLFIQQYRADVCIFHDDAATLPVYTVVAVIKAEDAADARALVARVIGSDLSECGRAVEELQILVATGFACGADGQVATVQAGLPEQHCDNNQKQ